MKRKILANNARTKRYLAKLPHIYVIIRWASHGILSYPCAGTCTADGVPYVWQYNDLNGLYDRYYLVKLTDVTSGEIYAWTTSERRATEIVDALRAREIKKAKI